MGEVRVEQRGRVLLATLDNPPHGLMDSGTVAGLEAVVARAEAEPGLGGVVLTGAHPERFVAHYDIGELLAASRAAPTVGPRAARASLRAVGALRRMRPVEEALGRTPAAGLVLLERFHATLLRMNRCGAVFVAAINGSALGGGSELALAVDRAVALADRLGSRAKAAIGACKRAVYDGGSLPLADGLRLERAEFLAGLGSPEAQTAMTGYLEALERTGELPGYDRVALEHAVETGAFRPSA